MKLSDIIDFSKNKSETTLKEISDQLSIPIFKDKDAHPWTDSPQKIVVIGSGIGGMASGALFAKAGHQVTVLEMHDKLIGGHGRSLSFAGMNFSMGPQYVWEFGDNQVGDRFLKFLEIKDKTPFVPMQQDGFERIFINHETPSGNQFRLDFKVPLGLDKFCQALVALFPDERKKLEAFFDEMISIYGTYRSFLRRHSFAEGRLLLATKFLLTGEVPMAMKLKLGRVIYLSLEQFFDHFEINSLLRRIIYGHGGIFAESESEMSAIAFIIGTGNYHEGAFYPRYGFPRFFALLSSVIHSNGGSVETGKRVVQLTTQNNRITEALCEDHSRYPCDFVFSDISPRLTYALLGKDPKIFDYAPANSIPTCCIGLREKMKAIAAMCGRNYWWQCGSQVTYCNTDITRPPEMLYIASPSANGYCDSTAAANDALVVFCPGNYLKEKEIYRQGQATIDAFKAKLADNIVMILDHYIFPGIRDKVDFAHVISSVDIKNDTGGELGNAYGRRLTTDEILKGAIKEEDAPLNLHNVSATKNSPGIASGIFTAELIFEELTGIAI